MGLITLIGLTTANPYHSINPAIRSRCQLFEVKSLNDSDIEDALNKACNYLDKIEISSEAIRYISRLANGDLRYAYNLLEIAYYASDDFKIELEDVKKINNKPSLYIDKNDDGLL